MKTRYLKLERYNDDNTNLTLDLDYTFVEVINHKITLKDKYVPVKDDKLYIYPECNIPRFKIKTFTEANNIAIVKYKEKANVHFSNNKFLNDNIYNLDRYYKVRTKSLQKVFNQIPSQYLKNCQEFITDLRNYTEEYVLVNSRKFYKFNNTYHALCGINCDFKCISELIDEENPLMDHESKINPDLIDYILDTSTLIELTTENTENISKLLSYTVYDEKALVTLLNSDIVMDEDLYTGCINLFKSKDSDNHKIAMESMANCNYEESCVYLMLLIKDYRKEMYDSDMKHHINFKSFLKFFDINLNYYIGYDNIVEKLIKFNKVTRKNINLLLPLATEQVNDSGNTTYFKHTGVSPTSDILELLEKEEEVFPEKTDDDNSDLGNDLTEPVLDNNTEPIQYTLVNTPTLVESIIEEQPTTTNMIQTPKTKEELEKEFYSKPFNLSYSGLNKLLYSPKMFYNHYILKQREDRTDAHLVDGKVIHCLLLNDGSFDEEFILMPTTLPTGNSRTVIDKVFEYYSTYVPETNADGTTAVLSPDLADHSVKILEILQSINLHQSLTDDKKAPFKKGDDKRLEKIITEETISYFEFLKTKGDRTLIDSETLQRCNESVDYLKADSKVCELLGLYKTEMENIEMVNETLLSSDTAGYEKIGLKGVIDSFQINYDKKVIYVNDLKTTGKTITDFPETIKFYNYNIQASIYLRLIKELYKDIITPEWSVAFNFIVIDKYFQVYCFEVSPQTEIAWDDILGDKLMEAHWHYENNNYTLPYDFAVNRITL